VSIGKELLISDVSRSGWANQQLLDGCAALSAEELERDLRISHNSILATLRHIYDGERVWLLLFADYGGPRNLAAATRTGTRIDSGCSQAEVA
jgi:uncharacterized damage-inducible protein DinB